MVLAQDLPQKDPQRDEGRIDPINPIHRMVAQRLGDNQLRQHIAKRQSIVLKKLLPQKTQLLSKSSLMRKRHCEASLPEMGV